jgi:SAM-dependent methyltransferase
MTNCRDAWEKYRPPVEGVVTSPNVIQTGADKVPVWLPDDFSKHSTPFAVHKCALCSDTKPPVGSTVLEIGCGTGSSAIYLAQLGYKVSGFEAQAVYKDWHMCALAPCAEACISHSSFAKQMLSLHSIGLVGLLNYYCASWRQRCGVSLHLSPPDWVVLAETGAMLN